MTELPNSTALVPSEITGAQIMERVAITGDLSVLRPEERVAYYARVCESLGLNPLTKPFDYINLNGKLTLYAKRDATDQIRRNVGISVLRLDYPVPPDGLFIVVAYGRARDGREDSSSGIVNVKNLAGEVLANAMMKAETKAKRRLTLSLAGLGFPDETEIGSIPDAEEAIVDEQGAIQAPTLVEKIAARAQAVAEPEPRTETVATVVDDVAATPESAPESSQAETVQLRDGSVVSVAVQGSATPGLAAAIDEHEAEMIAEFGELTLQEFAIAVKDMDRDYVRLSAKRMYPAATRFGDLAGWQRAALLREIDGADLAAVEADTTEYETADAVVGAALTGVVEGVTELAEIAARMDQPKEYGTFDGAPRTPPMTQARYDAELPVPPLVVNGAPVSAVVNGDPVAENGTVDDATTCTSESPFTPGVTCVRDAGHTGFHEASDKERW